jgi:predicted DNA-binding transcriptional regulator YafY
MSAARTERLLNLLTLLLNSRRPISLREIRELDEFGAYQTDDPKSGERAFERDKSALLALGVPLRWVAPDVEDEDDGLGGYVVDRDHYYLPDLALKPQELAMLTIAGAAAAAIDGFSGKAAVIRALAKLGFDVDENEGTVAPTLAHAPLTAGLDPERIGAHLALLHDATAHRRRVALSYGAATGTTQRKVDPYGLYYRQGNWYLVGHCHLRRAERTFHVGRMLDVHLASNLGAFEVPPFFDLKAHVDKRPWEFPHAAPMEVAIRLAERLRPAIPDIFGRRVRIEETAAGPVVHLTITHQDALLAAVLPYGAAAEVLQPPDLRRQVGAIFATLAARYAPPGETPCA